MLPILSSMGFLNKLFKNKSRIWVDRSPRVRIIPLHHLAFALEGDTAPQSVNDISVSGVGLQNSDALAALKVGEIFKANLTIRDKRMLVALQVVFVAERIGCQFQQAPAELGALIAEYLRFEAAAIRLAKVDAKFMQQDKSGDATWFVDDDNNELYFTKQGGRINAFHLTVLGNYLEWSGGVARFGVVLRTGDRKPYKMADMINYSSAPAGLGDVLERFFSNMPHLHPDEKMQLLEALKIDLSLP
jgi:PilZ domain